ncbi:MAG TPA: hypothetical protein VEL07_09140 [Planctomycetota bacterium]|nr:hypothetical protein [Planctomycetota bacterium]
MVVRPYVSTRTGSGQWMAQRVSAGLLLILAFAHFGIQHFTSDAVSTGLTVAARMHDAWWQAYYVVFIALAMYHGINGVIGILRDYALPPRPRLLAEIILWTVGGVFAAVGIVNILSPRPLGGIKEIYATHGFVAGESRGSPPLAPAIAYDFRAELRELHLLSHYWDQHTSWDEEETDEPFPERLAKSEPVNAESVAKVGKDFDEWALDLIESPAGGVRDTHMTFASPREFALWAANVRKANALARSAATPSPRETAILERLADVPPYRASDRH